MMAKICIQFLQQGLENSVRIVCMWLRTTTERHRNVVKRIWNRRTTELSLMETNRTKTTNANQAMKMSYSSMRRCLNESIWRSKARMLQHQRRELSLAATHHQDYNKVRITLRVLVKLLCTHRIANKTRWIQTNLLTALSMGIDRRGWCTFSSSFTFG